MNEPTINHQSDIVLELIDEAVASATRIVHACVSDTTRDHLEYALALLRESWIAESGQQARSAEQVITDVQEAMNLFSAIANFNQETKS